MSFKFPLSRLVPMEAEYLQRYGYTIPDELNTDAIEKVKDDQQKLMAIYQQLTELPEPKTDYFVSSDYSDITSASNQYLSDSLVVPSQSTIKDKIKGGWFGRTAACMLGKPLEVDLTMPEIKEFLKEDFPLDNYIRFEKAKEITLSKKAWLHPLVSVPCSLENIKYAMDDDDMNYTVLNLLLLEEKGFDFEPMDIGWIWSRYLPTAYTYGAETTSLVNYLWGLPLESIPIYLNPFRDEIGAQIRADMFGYVSPASPARAAELAYKDAAFSHVNDGIYGEMFVAAMIAAAFCSDDTEEIVNVGLGQVPQGSRLYELVSKTIEWFHSLGDWQQVYHKIKQATPQYTEGHTVNNAAYVVNALLASKSNYEKGITIAVMQGHDTDCNGATVGSVLGVCSGAKKLPGKWIDLLNDHLKTNLNGYSDVSISQCSERTFKLTKNQLDKS